ncbi:MAG TPA: 2Fe-2S iron-sulfur cluster-binding protein [Candidatus Thermoplasmatota archaeon]|nr:2Fe-2S iron-sulfur cluster-binding protein [Candidatus Thermoplasmatota archaeon]
MVERIERTRGKPIRFTFDGRAIEAHEGETLAAALHAARVKVLSRSLRYHRPRGLFCNAGACANCVVRVDGRPSVRACLEPARAGAVVESQNAWPSAATDVFGLLDRAYPRYLDYHTQFARFPVARDVQKIVVRRMAGRGELPSIPAEATPAVPVREGTADVLVVGAGPAGLAAAVAAAAAGARTVLLESSPRAGGRLRTWTRAVAGAPDGPAALADLLDRAGRHRVEIRTSTEAVAWYAEESRLVSMDAEGLAAWRAGAIVLATGSYENPPLVPSNDLPGVFGARGAIALLADHGVLPGKRVVVAGATPDGLVACEALVAAGADVTLVDEGVKPAWDPPARVVRLEGRRVAAVLGATQVEAVEVERAGVVERLDADALLAAHDATPRPELLQQTGAPVAFDAAKGGFHAVVDGTGWTGVGAFHAAGAAAGSRNVETSLAEGARAGAAAARRAMEATR